MGVEQAGVWLQDDRFLRSYIPNVLLYILFDNMDYMNQVGDVFYLKASTDTILQHLAMSRGERPLLKNKTPEQLRSFVVEQLAQREPFYAKAQHVVDVNVLDSFDKISLVTQHICQELGDE